MDFLSSTTTNTMISSLNGYSLRHKVISANIANARTPEYQRNDVVFEDQLKQALGIARQRQEAKERFSAGLSVSPIIPGLHTNQNPFENVKPVVVKDDQSPVRANGNNVQLEYEMAELAKNGMKYDAIAQMLSKKYQGMSTLIKQASS